MAERLSGGDCDGDIIQIIWNEDFLNQFNPHVPDEPKEKNTLKKPIEKSLIPKINNYCETIIDMFWFDYVGKIASLH